MACGAGFLLSLLFTSEFAVVLLGIALVIGGLFCARKQ